MDSVQDPPRLKPWGRFGVGPIACLHTRAVVVGLRRRLRSDHSVWYTSVFGQYGTVKKDRVAGSNAKMGGGAEEKREEEQERRT